MCTTHRHKWTGYGGTNFGSATVYVEVACVEITPRTERRNPRYTLCQPCFALYGTQGRTEYFTVSRRECCRRRSSTELFLCPLGLQCNSKPPVQGKAMYARTCLPKPMSFRCKSLSMASTSLAGMRHAFLLSNQPLATACIRTSRSLSDRLKSE